MTTLDEGVTVGGLPLGVIAISVMLAAAIFAFDLSLPLGVAGGVPYVALVLVGLWSPWRPYLLLLAATAIALTILGFVLSPPGGEPWVVATNRALAMFAICAAAALVYQCRRSDEAQRESEVRYRELIESSPDAILVHTGGKIVFANAFAAKLLGRRRPEDLIGVPALEIVPPDDREEIRERQRRTGESDGKVAFGEERLLALDGSTVAVEVTAVPVRFDGDPAIQLVARDISERKVAEREIGESEERLRQAARIAKLGYWVWDEMADRMAVCSEEYAAIYGMSVEEYMALATAPEADAILVHSEDREKYLKALLNSTKRGKRYRSEHRIVRADGGIRHVVEAGEPIFDDSGAVVRAVGTAQDITALKLAEQELQDAHDNLEVQVKDRTAELTEANAHLREEATRRKQIEESLRLTQFALDHAGDTVFWLGESGRFEYINQSGRQLLGYTGDELSAMHIWDVDPAVVQADWPSTWARTIGRGHHTFGAVHLTKAGAEFPVEVTTTPVSFGERQIICSFSRDIRERKRAEEALRSTTETLEAIFEASPVAINTIDLEGRLLNWNSASEAIFGWRKEEVLGKPLPYMPEAEREIFLERQEALYQGQSLSGLEARRVRKDGTPIDVSFSGAPLRDSSGRIVGAVGILEDITERKAAEVAQKESEQRFRDYAETASDWFWEMDGDLRFTYFSERFGSIGMGANDRIGKTRLEATAEDTSTKRWRDHQADLEAHRPFHNFEHMGRTRDGEPMYGEVSGKPIFDSAGEFKGYRGTGRDVTERSRAEKALQESEGLLRAIVDNSPLAIALKDSDLRYRLVNKQLEFWHGIIEEEIIGNTSHDIHPKELADAFVVQDNEVMKTSSVIENEFEIPSASGPSRTFAIVKFPIIDSEGKTVGVGSIGSNITERKRAEEALRESEVTLRSIVDNSPLIVVLKDVERRYVMANPHFCAVTGRAEEEVLGRTVEDVLRNDFAGPEAHDERKVLETGSVIEREIMLPTVQGDRPYHQVIYPVRDGSGGVIGIGAFATDITERKQADRSMRESETRLRAIVDHSPAVIALKDTEGRYVMVNRRGCELLGKTEDEVLGKTVHDLIPHEMAAVFSDHEQRVLATGEAIEQESPQVTPEGPCPYLEIKFPVLDASGATVAIGLVATDLTERKHTEAELLVAKEQAELANRAKSEFLANMSHELRTPLNAIIGFSEIISDELFGPVGNRKYKDYGADIHSSGVHLLSIINDLLDLSKIDAGKIELEDRELDIERVTEAAMQMVSESVEAAGLKAELQVADRLPGLRADERAVTQILLNLLSNATKFTPKGGRITVQVEVDGEHRFAIAVSDTGIGIAEDDLPRALAPFGQLESSFIRKYDGTGLGLPLVQKLVELHGGDFELESEAGAGTTATARFPSERTVYR